MSRTDLGEGWFQLDGTLQHSRLTSYHLYSIGVDGKIAMGNPAAITEILRQNVDFADAGLLVQQEVAKFKVSAFVDSAAGTFDVRLFNVTDTVLLATLNFSETVPTVKEVAFSLPSTTKIIALEWLRNGGAPSLAFNLQHVEMTWIVSP